MPLDYMTKIFLSHQHADHMGDLPTFWIYGMQNGRSKPLEVWGPGGGGMPDNWGTQNAVNGILQFYNWMLETSKGALDTRSLAITVHEYDWSMNSQPFPPPSVVARQQAAAGGEKYVTPEWILQGFAWDTLPVMNEVYKDFNKEFGTDFKFPLQPKEE